MVAGETDLVAQVEALSDEALVCRDLRHLWDVRIPYYLVDVEGGQRGAKYLERVIGCGRPGCPIERVELYRVRPERMERIAADYRGYPKEGYSLHDVPRGARVLELVRREAVRRAMDL
jgi:hypothetical protein